MITEESAPQQSIESIFLEKEYRIGQVFERKDCLNYNLGHSCYTGEYRENCEGIVMKFFDGKEVLSDFCKLSKIDCPEVLWAVREDLTKLENKFLNDKNSILNEYNKLH